MGTPVIAVNDGAGPTETVVNEETGFLCESNETAFAEAISKIAKDRDLQKKMGEQGRKRVLTHFSFENFATQLDAIIDAD